jgi:hypothetical protein
VTPLVDDPIVQEVRRIRDEIAKAHGYDPEAIFAMLQAEQQKHPELLVSRQPKRIENPAFTSKTTGTDAA